MKNVINHLLLICFLFISTLSYSQSNSDTATVNSKFLFPQFTEGKVVLNDGTVAAGKLNYDTSIDQMQFMGVNDVVMNIAEPNKVVIVTIQNRNFIYLKDYFVEQLSVGPVMLCTRLHQSQLVEKIGAYGGASAVSSIKSLTSVDSGNGNYQELKSNDKVTYTKSLTYYVTINGKTKIVYDQNDFLKCFPSKKDLLKQEIDKENCKFSSVESVKKIVDWMNANGIKN
jgi:hypothetical protein